MDLPDTPPEDHQVQLTTLRHPHSVSFFTSSLPLPYLTFEVATIKVSHQLGSYSAVDGLLRGCMPGIMFGTDSCPFPPLPFLSPSPLFSLSFFPLFPSLPSSLFSSPSFPSFLPFPLSPFPQKSS